MTTPLKEKHRAVWASGDYAAVAADIIPELGALLVEAAGVQAGQEVLDVAAGTGNAAIPATLAGARVTASDLTPSLLEIGSKLAAERGAELDWVEADAEDLPFDTGRFDTVLSCVGVMFAPFHQTAADELVRVCRPGGTIALLSWTPAGFIGHLFGTMKPYAAPPPPGAQPPPLWGDEAHVRALLGDRVTAVEARTATVRVEAFAAASAFREYFKHNYGPTLAVYRSLADDRDRTAALDLALDELAARFRAPDGSMEWEYLLLTARRSGAPTGA
ncbi:class I SAM-dependent methyltransferase [Dactylosporangium darangshiense]|uniref:Class I SAM-dependent methyltransferase n=1 Tax=Dactylosporangium darangshiense TaxID=579108 RepID=A0ABP8DGP2_9ACTN